MRISHGRRFAFALLALAISGCTGGEDVATVRLLPEFTQFGAGVVELNLEGAGHVRLVTLRRVQGQWRVLERNNWPADAQRVQAVLADLDQANIIERKTERSDRYHRLGVEDLAAPNSQGLQLKWSGQGGRGELLLGMPGPGGQGRYVRLPGTLPALLVDRPFRAEREPLAWLDRAIIDVPLARIREIRVKPVAGTAFTIEREGENFVIAGLSSRLADATITAQLASVLDQLLFEDIAESSEAEPASDVEKVGDVQVQFLAVDGLLATLNASRSGARFWLTVSVGIDEQVAKDWMAGNAGGARLADSQAALRLQVQAWQSRLQGHRFLLSIERAAALVKTRSQYLVVR